MTEVAVDARRDDGAGSHGAVGDPGGAHDGHDGHGSHHLDAAHHRAVRLFGVVLLIIAESMIFVPLLATRLLLGGDRPPTLDQQYAAVLTGLMVASTVALLAARRLGDSGHWVRAAGGSYAAATLGLLTAIGVGYGWVRERIPTGSRFGEAYYLVTGAHAVHLVLGALFVAGLAGQLHQRRPPGDAPVLLRAVSWFWIFLLVVWAAVYVVFYVL